MAVDLAHEFLRWLDIIPGRGWLVVGASELATAIRQDTRPNAVTELAPVPTLPLPYETGVFDVAVAELTATAANLVPELRRVIWPSGTVGAYSHTLSATELELLFREAGLRAIQSTALQGAAAVRGTR